MLTHHSLQTPVNRLLAALPAEEYQRLVPYLEWSPLPLAQVIHKPGDPITHVYFPHRALVSLLSTMEDGSAIEVGLIGGEGITGVPALLGDGTSVHRAFVQVAGDSVRLPVEVLKSEFLRGGKLQSLILRYMQALFTQVSQSAACNRLHSLEERLARWLLLVQDALDSSELPLTQEFIAQMIGVRRSGVTVAAGNLQQAGMICYSRGKITIQSRESLEETACECYRAIKTEFARLMGGGPGQD